MKARGFATKPAPPERRCTATVVGRINTGAQCKEWGTPREDGQLRCHQHQHDQPHSYHGSGDKHHRFPPEVITAFLADVRATYAGLGVSLDSRTWTEDDKWTMREQGVTISHFARKYGISVQRAYELVRAASGNPPRARWQDNIIAQQRRQAKLAHLTEAMQKIETRLQRKREECTALEARLADIRKQRNRITIQLRWHTKEAA